MNLTEEERDTLLRLLFGLLTIIVATWIIYGAMRLAMKQERKDRQKRE